MNQVQESTSMLCSSLDEPYNIKSKCAKRSEGKEGASRPKSLRRSGILFKIHSGRLRA